MASVKRIKGIIGILTGGGDVPGLNPAIRVVTIRAIREGVRVIGIRRGWKGLVSCIGDKKFPQDGGQAGKALHKRMEEMLRESEARYRHFGIHAT